MIEDNYALAPHAISEIASKNNWVEEILVTHDGPLTIRYMTEGAKLFTSFELPPAVNKARFKEMLSGKNVSFQVTGG